MKFTELKVPLIGQPETPIDFHLCNAWCGDGNHVDVWHFHNYKEPISFEATTRYLNDLGFDVQWLGPAEAPCGDQTVTCERVTVRLTRHKVNP